MASFKSHPVFSSLLIVICVVVAGEAWICYNRFEVAKKSAAGLRAKRTELASLEAVRPFPSEESKAAVEADLRRTQVALDTMRAQLKGRGPAAEQLRNTKIPAEPTDMFFDLATFIEKTREKAQQGAVKIKADERFGFATYANAGPERDLIPQVFLQRQIAQYLIEALIDAHPSELVSLQRERPLTKAQRDLLGTGQSLPPVSRSSAPGGESDLFEIDPRITARVPGFVVATSFRLNFIGDTGALRAFLNKLATFELPLVVRSVEVAPATATAGTAGSATTNQTTLSAIFSPDAATATPATVSTVKTKPLVEKILSQFTVTVEFIDLVTTTAAGATPTS